MRNPIVSDLRHEAWEHDDYVRRSVLMPGELAGRLAAEAERRGVSVGDLLIEYAEAGLRAGGTGPAHPPAGV
jgi:hypothetical protein